MHGRGIWLARSAFGVNRIQVWTDRPVLGHPVSVDGAFPPSFRRVVNGWSADKRTITVEPMVNMGQISHFQQESSVSDRLGSAISSPFSFPFF